MVERVLFGPGGATEAKQDDIIAALASIGLTLDSNSRYEFDYTGGPTAADPVYIGKAAYTEDTSDPTWKVMKLTYTGLNVTKIETRIAMAWDDRTSPSPAWD